MTFDTFIVRDENEIAVTVEFSMSRGYKGARDSLCGVRRAGPPLEPDEPPEATILSVLGPDSTDYVDSLNDGEVETLLEKCYEYVADNSEL
jgi:hypothetical protein